MGVSMRSNSVARVAVVAVVVLAAAGGSMAAEWKFPVGFAYSSGFGDVTDYYEQVQGADVGFSFPVGVVFSPYRQWDGGFQMGLDVGPIAVILLDSGDSSADFSYFDVPLGVSAGFKFRPSAGTSPHVRAGIRYHVTSGDFVSGRSPGLFGAAGLEWGQKKKVSMGVEAMYDAATVEFEPGVDIKVNKFLFAFRVIF